MTASLGTRDYALGTKIQRSQKSEVRGQKTDILVFLISQSLPAIASLLAQARRAGAIRNSQSSGSLPLTINDSVA